MMVPFSEFLKFLASCSVELKPSQLPHGVQYCDKPDPSYVEPTLTLESQPAVGQASVVLVVAPGAVGKTTLAKEIANKKKAMYWDLSKFQVGTNTLAGTLFASFGAQASEATKGLKEGSFLVVLDALDEAQLRSGPSNFDAFLADIANSVYGSSGNPSIVLLARSETAEWISLWLQDRQIPTSRFKLDFFDEEKSREFVSRKLDRLFAGVHRQPLHRTQKEPFESALNEFFSLVYHILGVDSSAPWSDERVQSFLGYAPVLETVSGYMFGENFHNLRQELASLKARTSSDGLLWKFLSSIVKAILKRERLKVVEALKSRLKKASQKESWSSWDDLYHENEQCHRVLNRYLKSDQAWGGAAPPPALLQEYEIAVKENLAQHPFVGERGDFPNAVFREYVFAWALDEKSDKNLRADLRAKLVTERYLPSPILARVFLTRSLAEDDVAYVRGEDFGLFYDSLSAQSDSGTFPYVQMWTTREGSFALITIGAEMQEELLVGIMPGDIWLWQHLGPADIDVNNHIRVGFSEQPFFLGPDVRLRAKRLTANIGDLQVETAGGVYLHADEFHGEGAGPRILLTGDRRGGTFRVTWPNAAYPWSTFYHKPVDSSGYGGSDETWSVIRKFLLMFRRQRARKKETVHKARWSTAEYLQRDRLIQIAVKWGVIRAEKISYIFESAYDSLKTLFDMEYKPTEKADQFLRESIRTLDEAQQKES